jgi:hypothetical protein
MVGQNASSRATCEPATAAASCYRPFGVFLKVCGVVWLEVFRNWPDYYAPVRWQRDNAMAAA